MITPTKGSGGVLPLYPPNSYSNAQAVGKASTIQSQYDQVSISQGSTQAQQFQQQLVARLAQEVRTVHTTGDIQRIKAEVQSGTYQPDAAAIAARLLLEGPVSGNN